MEAFVIVSKALRRPFYTLVTRTTEYRTCINILAPYSFQYTRALKIQGTLYKEFDWRDICNIWIFMYISRLGFSTISLYDKDVWTDLYLHKITWITNVSVTIYKVWLIKDVNLGKIYKKNKNTRIKFTLSFYYVTLTNNLAFNFSL